jgi:hypothetical protein
MSRKSSRKGRRAKGRRGSPPPTRQEIGLDELLAIVERTRTGALSESDHATLRAAVDTLTTLTRELEQSDVTIGRLQRLLFGPSSEKTRDVVGASPVGASDGEDAGEGASPPSNTDPGTGGDTGDAAPSGVAAAEGGGTPEADSAEADSAEEEAAPAKAKGHGRRGANAYSGAERVPVPHDALTCGQRCPLCKKGKLYEQKPAVILRVRGVAPLAATVYELQRLRCNLCGEIFTARAPPEIGEEKYDETAAALLALLRYGYGLPLNRLERLGKNLGIPLPSSTQWDVVDASANANEPVWHELIRHAADGDVIRIDDTHSQVLALDQLIRAQVAVNETDRTGIFTSGLLSTVGGRQVALFFTGRQHAGENFARVLEQRSPGLPAPIQMSDALSRNTSHEINVLVAACLVHARRNFVDLAEHFPAEVVHMLTELGKVYAHDAKAREQDMDKEARLRHHQEHSRPVMDALAAWLQTRFDEKLVEPNSTLGKAIRYMQRHWEKLTLFLRVAGAPLDNNLCEQMLKRAILHRKNSLFYRTERGAAVGDSYMSLIYTAELCGANPFEYLVALQRHASAVAEHPERWMPWNYAEALAAATS